MVAQDLNPKKVSEVNKWSFELGFGSNRAIQPFGTGYNSSDKEFFNLQSLNHFDFGFRYMLNSKFGIKSDIAFDEITNKLENGSLPFRSLQYRIGFQGVVDLGKVFDISSFTHTIGLLGHGGFQFSKLKSKSVIGNQEAVTNGDRGFILGITPQIKLSEWTVLTTDFSLLSNHSQRLNWDGSVAAKENSLIGLLYSTSIGITFYLGNNEHHSDWFVPKKESQVDLGLTQHLDQRETQLKNSVKDIITAPSNTQNNATSSVDEAMQGVLNTNKNEVSDPIASQILGGNKIQNLAETIEKSENNTFKILLDSGLLNVFYDTNQDEPNSGSINSVYGIISLLKKNPSVNVKLVGYTDRRGREITNLNLSERRVKKLYNLLVSSGISGSRLKILGKGVDHSILSNSEAAYQLARRVSVLFDSLN
jgi:OOP family OmpA-OmpF porin